MRFPRLSLLAKIWLSTAVVVTTLYAITGLLLQRHTLAMTNQSLQEEVRASLQAYESLWRSRSDTLASVAAIISSTPNVRAAFQTRHRPTIQDAAGELWVKVADELKENAFFTVADPEGNTVASLDSAAPGRLPDAWPMIATVRQRFPKQAAGFAVIGNQLYQLVFTPVYVDSTGGSSLVSVLVSGFSVDHSVAERLRESTGGSEFLFLAGGRVFASTLNDRATSVLRREVLGSPPTELISDGVVQYARLDRELIDVQGRPLGKLIVFRSFEAARVRLRNLQRWLFLVWLAAVAAGLGFSFLLARRIIQPLNMLDRAAARVAHQDYTLRLPVQSQDELGRLAATFNSMCESLQQARDELIRQERISTIGRLASSIVHDLRNPLAAIYGGAEMMVDTELTSGQVKRLAANIYRSSRRIQEMLQDLLQVTRGRSGEKEVCLLRDVVEAGIEPLQTAATAQRVTIEVRVPEQLELPLERMRIERVFMNLVGNALEVLPDGGHIHVTASDTGDAVEIQVADDGPGIQPAVRGQLFQPFVTHGKKTGLGLGLALSRQSVLDHGGDLWIAENGNPGATFCLRLPKQSRPAAVPA
ncbi:MAG: HAMP domain-containing protein [Bryobacterales bacterium]|nr:HAMP domain-containing protein [Bryobacterales bacterium]